MAMVVAGDVAVAIVPKSYGQVEARRFRKKRKRHSVQ